MLNQTFKKGQYSTPIWSQFPIFNYQQIHLISLEVIKQGIILQNIPLDQREFFIIGKNKQVSHIILEHQSISQQHAVIQHGREGTIYVMDLDSTHNTFLNSRPIIPFNFERISSFDQLRFGCSTRLYVLRCMQLQNNDEEDQVKKQQSQKLISKSNLFICSQQDKENRFEKLRKNYLFLLQKWNLGGWKIQELKKYDGVTWGIDDENEIYRQENQRLVLQPELLLQLPELDYGQINLIRKYSQVKKKHDDIFLKLNELRNQEQRQLGLDQINAQKKFSYEKKIMESSSQLEKFENKIRRQLFKESATQQKAKILKNIEEDTFQDDQYLDRTKAHITSKSVYPQYQQNNSNFDLIKSQLEERLYRKAKVNHLLLSLVTNEFNSQQLDQYQKFMLANQNSLKIQTKQKLLDELKELNQRIEYLEGMLKRIQKHKIINIEINFNGQQQQEQRDKKIKQLNRQRFLRVLKNIEEQKEERQENEEDQQYMFNLYREQIKKKQERKKKKLKQNMLKQEKDEQEAKPRKLLRPIEKPASRDEELDQDEDFIDLTKFN